MTDRGLPIVDGAPACPFVAFEDDRDGRGQAPDHRHRCFAEPRPAPRALAHQEAYCLSSAFPVCPTFQDWARREAATARAAQAEADAAALEEPPVSQALPPRELDPRNAADLDDPAPLPPRRNPPRDWAAPPPWAGDTDGEPAEAPSFLAPPPQAAPPAASADRAAAYGAEARGLAGSAADRLAGPYVDDDGAGGPGQPDPGWPAGDADDDPNARYRPPTAGVAAAGAVAGAASMGAATPSAGASPSARQPSPDPAPRSTPPAAGSGRAGRDPAAAPASASSTRKPAAGPKVQDPSELFGPAWERPRRYEAYPTLKSRVSLPSVGGIPKIGVAAIAVVLAALALFFVGPMLLGIGSDSPGGGGGGAPASQPAEELSPTARPTAPPAPTPQTYIVAKGDTMLKIARKFHVTVEQLLAANPKVKNADRIAIGDELNIPVPEDDAGG
jgi:hypothetical protein